jgi:hypothetical protein
MIGAIETMTDISPLKRARRIRENVETQEVSGVIRAIDVIVETRDPYTAWTSAQVQGSPSQRMAFRRNGRGDLRRLDPRPRENLRPRRDSLSKPGRISETERVHHVSWWATTFKEHRLPGRLRKSCCSITSE